MFLPAFQFAGSPIDPTHLVEQPAIAVGQPEKLHFYFPLDAAAGKALQQPCSERVEFAHTAI